MGLLMAGGPLVMGVLMVLTEVLKWPRKVHYVWAGIILLFGIGLIFF